MGRARPPATCARAISLSAGPTSNAADYYVAHDRPRQLWVRELGAGALRKLRAAKLPPARGVQLVSAVTARAQRWLGAVPVASPSNEIPAVPQLLVEDAQSAFVRPN